MSQLEERGSDGARQSGPLHHRLEAAEFAAILGLVDHACHQRLGINDRDDDDAAAAGGDVELARRRVATAPAASGGPRSGITAASRAGPTPPTPASRAANVCFLSR